IKQAGLSVGWGMHFQQPLFLGSISLILLAFSGSLFGWFHFKIPRVFLWLESKSVPTIRSEHKSINRLNHFLTGAFATVLATPCSAPFVGTALSFALSHGPLEIFSIFIAMGIGLSSPYLLICIRPELLRFLPRPGAWMKKLEIILGVLLILTAVWIFTILYQQIDLNWFIAGVLLIGGGFLTFGLYHVTGSIVLKIASLCLPVIALIVIEYADQRPIKTFTSNRVLNTGTSNDNIIWREFDPLLIPDIIKQGKFVFVDVTADWCLTCKMNEKFVLSSKMIRKLLSRNEIIKMKADWTLPDITISSYLTSYNKFGIPLNVIYGPNAEKGIVLPELLSKEKIFNAFFKAGLQQNNTSQPNYIEKTFINGKNLEK
ncbi:MAG: copper-binding protein, partial [Rhodospirillaceae bacterium]|nr:copper-binding protein [Rhodospirillaceae bacterium]